MTTQPIDLVIAGAQKAGTTSLFQYIKQHPEVRAHEQLEMTFFFNDHEFERGYEEAFERYFGAAGKRNEAVVAKHVMTMYSSRTLERIRRHNPQARLILLLRNPIIRAYSAYWYARQRGWEDIDSFEAALEAEPTRMERDDWRRWRACAYVANGQYDVHLRRIHERFDPTQIRVYTTEDLKDDAGGLVRDIYRWIGVDDAFSPEVTQAHNVSAQARLESLARLSARIFKSRNRVKLALRSMLPNKLSYKLRQAILRANEKPFSPPPMDERTYETLLECFLPHNAKLARLVGRDFAVWNDQADGVH